MESTPFFEKRRTAWHPIFLRVLRAVLPVGAFDVHPEYQLNQQPQRIDAVVVRRVHPAPEPESGVLRRLVHRLGVNTLIEFKGPTDILEAQDLLWLFGYAFQYCARAGLRDRAELRLMVVASRMGKAFRMLAEHYAGVVTEEEEGVYAIAGLPYLLYVIEAERAGDQLLRFFARTFLQEERGRLFALLNEDERAIFRAIYNEVIQFRRDPTTPQEFQDFEVMTMSMQELIDYIIRDQPPEKLLANVNREQLVAHMSPEERLKGLGPEELLAHLSPEERERLKNLLLK